jgi:exoribonuclease-2
VFAGDAITDLRPDTKNRAKELIEDLMIAANAATAATLGTKGLCLDPARARRAATVGPDRGARAPRLATRCRPRRMPPRSTRFCVKRRDADPLRFPDVSLSVVKMLGSGEYAVEPPGSVPSGHFGLP